MSVLFNNFQDIYEFMHRLPLATIKKIAYQNNTRIFKSDYSLIND
jgi:hypothetical protein